MRLQLGLATILSYQSVAIGPPPSGTALTITAASGASALTANGTDIALAAINASAITNRAAANFSQAGTTYLRVGIDGSQIFNTDSTNSDGCISLIRGGTLRFSAAPTATSIATQMSLNSTGNVTIAAPTSGIALTITAASAANGLYIAGTDVATIGLVSASAASRSIVGFGTVGATNARVGTDGSNALLTDSANGDLALTSTGKIIRFGQYAGATQVAIGTAGNVTVAAAASGETLTVTAGQDLGGITINGAKNNVSLTLNNTQAGATANWRISSVATGGGFPAGSLAIGPGSSDFLGISAAGNVSIAAPASGVALTATSFAGSNAFVANGANGSYAAQINGANSTNGYGLAVQGGYTGAGNISLVAFNDSNNTNGVNLLLVGNGATTPNKYIRVISGQFQIINSSYTANLLTLNDAGNMTLPTLGAQLSMSDGTHGATIFTGNGLVQGDGTNMYVRPQNAGTLYLGANATNFWSISPAGNVGTSTVPTSGIALTVVGLGGGFGAALSVRATVGTTPADVDSGEIANIVNLSTTGDNRLITFGQVAADAFIRPVQQGASAAAGLQIYTQSGNTRFAPSGAVTISAPSSGTALSVTGVASYSPAVFSGAAGTGVSAGVFINAGTNVSDYALACSNQANTKQFFKIWGDGSFALGNSGSVQPLSGNSAGSIAIQAPTGGASLVVSTFAGQDAVIVSNAATTSRSSISIQQTSGNSTVIGLDGTQQILPSSTNGDFCLRSNQTIRLSANGYVASQITLATAGNVTIAAPSSGIALKVTGFAGSSALQLLTTGMQVGAPTGGDQGSGTINVASGVYINGVAVASGGIPQNSQSAAYTLVLADANRHIYHPSADTTARAWTIPANASVAFPIGTAVTFDNDTGAGVITLAVTSDTLVWLPGGTTGTRTLAAGGQVTALKVAAARWHLTGVGVT